MSSLQHVEVAGVRYALRECVYLQPWPNAAPWIGRIEEILARIGKTNKVESFLGIRWFYRRRDLLPSHVANFPPCEDPDHEVYMTRGRPDEVNCKTLLGRCNVVCSNEVSDLSVALQDADTYFYRYEYNPKGSTDLFTLPGGVPIAPPASTAPAQSPAVSNPAPSRGSSSSASVAQHVTAAPAPAAAMLPPPPRHAKRAKHDDRRPGGCVMVAPALASSSAGVDRGVGGRTNHSTAAISAAGAAGAGSSGSSRGVASGSCTTSVTGSGSRNTGIGQVGGGVASNKSPSTTSSSSSSSSTSTTTTTITTAAAAAAAATTTTSTSSSSSSKSALGIESDSSSHQGHLVNAEQPIQQMSLGHGQAAPRGSGSGSSPQGEFAIPESCGSSLSATTPSNSGGVAPATKMEEAVNEVFSPSFDASSAAPSESNLAAEKNIFKEEVGREAQSVLEHANAGTGTLPAAAHGSVSTDYASTTVNSMELKTQSFFKDPAARPRTHGERLQYLQHKLDAMYPPFVDESSGRRCREFDAVIPVEGEHYAGEGCARCMVIGCERFGRLFHIKNLMTHAAPRGGQPSRIPSANRAHSTALVKLLGYTPDPPPPLPEGQGKRISKKEKAYQKAHLTTQEGTSDGQSELTAKQMEGRVVVHASMMPSDKLASCDLPTVTAMPLPYSKPHKRPPAARNADSRNFNGNESGFIQYRGMKLRFHNGQVLLVRRQQLGPNPARNVKFLGNLRGRPSEWEGALRAAKERAEQAGLILGLYTQYDQMHLTQPGGLDSNHCLHLFNHYRPAEKKMINKWETYMPIALHRTYDRLLRQSQYLTACTLDGLEFEGLFNKLRQSDLDQAANDSSGKPNPRLNKSRCLLLVTRRWVAAQDLASGERVVSRFEDGREWYTGEVGAVKSRVVAGKRTVLYDVRYDDGDFESEVPEERVLSVTNNEGQWEYIVVGPEEASALLPNDQTHPWWPNAEQFVDFVVVEATKSELPQKVQDLRDAAATRYRHLAEERPWPLESRSSSTSEKRENQRTEGETEAQSADAHYARLCADLKRPEIVPELIYMFRKLSRLFLAVIDADLRYSHLQPSQPDTALLRRSAMQKVEHEWLCAPVAEIAEGTRQKCDVCETSILDRHWACTVAGCEWEVCLQCHRQGERRRAARRERYERLQRGDRDSFIREHPVARASYMTQSGRASFSIGSSKSVSYRELNQLPPPSRDTSIPWAARRNDYTGNEQSLQEKIDLAFPPVTNKGKHTFREFVAVLPKDGRYAGQPCARCEVPNCTMYGKVFHHKNIATHGRPRGASCSKSHVYSRAHDSSFNKFLGIFAETSLSVDEATEKVKQFDTNDYPIPVYKRGRPRKHASDAITTHPSSNVEHEPAEATRLARRSSRPCPACKGKHRAHVCGKRVRPAKRIWGGGKRRRQKKRYDATAALLTEANVIVGDGAELGHEGRRKRRRTSQSPTLLSERQAALVTRQRAQQALATEQAATATDEEELGCFCDTDRHLPTNDIPFEGVWVQCDSCSRWCHGECCGLDKQQAEALDDFVCPVCEAEPPSRALAAAAATAKQMPTDKSDPLSREEPDDKRNEDSSADEGSGSGSGSEASSDGGQSGEEEGEEDSDLSDASMASESDEECARPLSEDDDGVARPLSDDGMDPLSNGAIDGLADHPFDDTDLVDDYADVVDDDEDDAFHMSRPAAYPARNAFGDDDDDDDDDDGGAAGLSGEEAAGLSDDSAPGDDEIGWNVSAGMAEESGEDNTQNVANAEEQDGEEVEAQEEEEEFEIEGEEEEEEMSSADEDDIGKIGGIADEHADGWEDQKAVSMEPPLAGTSSVQLEATHIKDPSDISSTLENRQTAKRTEDEAIHSVDNTLKSEQANGSTERAPLATDAPSQDAYGGLLDAHTLDMPVEGSANNSTGCSKCRFKGCAKCSFGQTENLSQGSQAVVPKIQDGQDMQVGEHSAQPGSERLPEIPSDPMADDNAYSTTGTSQALVLQSSVSRPIADITMQREDESMATTSLASQDAPIDRTSAPSCRVCRRGPGKCRKRGLSGHLTYDDPDLNPPPRESFERWRPQAAPQTFRVGSAVDAAEDGSRTATLHATGLLRDKLARRPGGTSIPVGADVRILRPGEFKDKVGTVTIARSGYYQVRLLQEGPDGEVQNTPFFRGKELWLTEDGEPPEAAAIVSTSGKLSAIHQASLLTNAPGGLFGGADAGGSGEAAGAGDGSGGTGTGDSPPKWWWQSWVGVRGARKRRPTQLYDASDGQSITPQAVPEGRLDNLLGPRRRDHGGEHGLADGVEVYIMKPGIHDGKIGTVLGMHNGYYQVTTEHGETINLRAKECQVLAPGEGEKMRLQQVPTSELPWNVAAYPSSATQPTHSEHSVYAPMRRPSRPYGSTHANRRPGRPPGRTVTDITVGTDVFVNREGAYWGMAGKVVASRNGYLVVQLGEDKSAYFRARDLSRSQGGSALPAYRGSDRRQKKAVASPARGKGNHGRSNGDNALADAPVEPRMSWRENNVAEITEAEPEAPHEHIYERAVKMPPEDLAAIVDRVEKLLAKLPPEVNAPPKKPVRFSGESLRLPPSTNADDQLAEFQKRWRRGEPVVFPGLDKRLRRKWGPHGFLQRFGAESVQMVDCRDGKSVNWLSLAHFFAGYLQPWTRALCPDTFRRMMLKLKDWPPDQDFQSKMPEYFEDLMQALPFPQYTHRDGVLNLAKYFPRQYVPPDLGPKMYNAYGRHASWQGMDPSTKKGGHTNLHCDVSDAVNVMVDVGLDDGEDDSDDEYDERLMMDDDLGNLAIQHGAIWDIYRWEDTDAILQLLHAVARERNVEITNNPIHDQLFYLDDSLRRRLREQYGVRGWRFVQRHGDAIFIPAGCPHQVRNLSSCVKVALDFVSPENCDRCVHLTDQFAKLPRGHHLSEDKLQVKTMLLHALSHISAALESPGAADGVSAAAAIAAEEIAAASRVPSGSDVPRQEAAAASVQRYIASTSSLAAAANDTNNDDAVNTHAVVNGYDDAIAVPEVTPLGSTPSGAASEVASSAMVSMMSRCTSFAPEVVPVTKTEESSQLQTHEAEATPLVTTGSHTSIGNSTCKESPETDADNVARMQFAQDATPECMDLHDDVDDDDFGGSTY